MKSGTRAVKEVTLYRIRVNTVKKNGPRKGLIARGIDTTSSMLSFTAYEYYENSRLASASMDGRATHHVNPRECDMIKFSDGSYVEIANIAHRKL